MKPINFIPAGSGLFAARRFYYRIIGKRAPKKGEWYLSGAIVEAYQAPNDLTTEYTIVEKTHRAVPRTIYEHAPLEAGD